MGNLSRLFGVLLLTCMALFGAPNYMQQLEQYDVQMKGANNDEMLRVFHGLKAVYIQAIISGDDNLKKETLERLIKTAKILKLDASKYEPELTTLGRETKKSAPSKPLIPPPAAEESFEASKNSASNTVSTTTPTATMPSSSSSSLKIKNS